MKVCNFLLLYTCCFSQLQRLLGHKVPQCHILELHASQNRASDRFSSISDTSRCDGRRSGIKVFKTDPGLQWHLYLTGPASRCQGHQGCLSVPLLHINTRYGVRKFIFVWRVKEHVLLTVCEAQVGVNVLM